MTFDLLTVLRALPVRTVVEIAEQNGLVTFGALLDAVIAQDGLPLSGVTLGITARLEGKVAFSIQRVPVTTGDTPQVIQAIKVLRDLTGWGLKESKDFVDALGEKQKVLHADPAVAARVWRESQNIRGFELRRY